MLASGLGVAFYVTELRTELRQERQLLERDARDATEARDAARGRADRAEVAASAARDLAEKSKTDFESTRGELNETKRRLGEAEKELAKVEAAKEAVKKADEATKKVTEEANKAAAAAKKASDEAAVEKTEAKRLWDDAELWIHPLTKLLTPKQLEKVAVDRCLKLIRDCQPTGSDAFVMRAEANVWIQPAAGARAALALLAEIERNPEGADSGDDRKRVLRWLRWYAANQNPDGTINHQTGPSTKPVRTTKRSPDSAAGFLIALHRFRKLTVGQAEIFAELRPAAELAFRSIESRIDAGDGLPWNDDTALSKERTKFFIGAVEDHAGLVAAKYLFPELGAAKQAEKAEVLADRLGKAVADCWREKDGRFTIYRMDGGDTAPLEKLYPDVRANLVGLAWVRPGARKLRDQLQTEFGKKIDHGQIADAPVEWWFFASVTDDHKEEHQKWRDRAVSEALLFTPNSVYVDRPALMLLALYEGNGWLFPTKSER